MQDIDQLNSAIAALEAQRRVLGDEVVNAAKAALAEQVARLGSPRNRDQPSLGQSLRLVSVLFVDVVQSTRLASQLDPEDLHALVDEALRRFRRVVEAHGGKALQYAGDSMLAAFGAEVTREDDGERSVNAGLSIIEEAKRYSEETRAIRPEIVFMVRAGIHSGPVLVGPGVDAETMIRGRTVGIAARMEQSAPAGALRISHATYRLVRGIFDVSEQPLIRVKDHEEEHRSYLVLRAKPRAFRSATRAFEGLETSMIGRDLEIAQLQDVFKRVVTTGSCGVVTVCAEAGLGKSRLLYEFQNWAELRPERFYLFQGKAFAEGQRLPYALLRSVFAWRWQISDDEGMDSAKEKLEREMVPLFKSEGGESQPYAEAHVLGQMIGLDFSESPHIAGIQEDGRQIRNRGFHAASQFFRRLAVRDGLAVVVLLEDLHWADEASLDFLVYLLQVSRDVPMMLVCSARPSLFDRRLAWPGTAGSLRIDMRPLDQGVSRLLAGELLKGLRDIPSALRQLIAVSSEGNPFYMEELVKMLVDEGAIETRSEPWRFVPDKLISISVPHTLVGVLQSRLDKLSAAERSALQQASVMGATFWENGLGAIDADSPSYLPSIAEKGLVRPEGQTLSEQGRAYEFAHQVLHRVTYDTVLKPERRLCHARVAHWLCKLTSAWAKEHLGIIADHFEKGGEISKACEYLADAAEDAMSRAANDAAIGYARHGLALLASRGPEADSNLVWRLHVCLERMAGLRGQRTEQEESLEVLTCLADEAGDLVRQGYVLTRRSDLAMRQGDYSTGQALAERAMQVATAAGNEPTRLRALTRAAANLHYLGHSEEAVALARTGLIDAKSAGLKSAQSFCLNVISVASLQIDPLQAIRAEISSQELCREANDRSGLAVATSNLSAGFLILGNLKEARQRLQEALSLSREIGDRDVQPYVLLNLAAVCWREGNDVETLALAREALEISTATGSRLKESGALYWLGNAQVNLGDLPAAKKSFAKALEIGEQIGHTQRFDAAAGAARVAMLELDDESSMSSVEPILVHLKAGGTLNGADTPRLIRLTCIEVLQRAADERAKELLVETHTDLMNLARRISSETDRDLFLALAEHRTIAALWRDFSAVERPL